MAGYRQFHTKFWKDGWVIDLEPLERYLFSYLFTNEQSSISGIYELPMKIISNETGLDKEFITHCLDKFQTAEKIFYQDGIMWVVNMWKHHSNASPLTMKKVNADVAFIPNCPVKTAYLYYRQTGKYCIDTVSIPYLYPDVKDKAKAKEESKAETEQPPRPNIFSLYESNIGGLNGMISDILVEAEKTYPPDWIEDAIAEAVKNNVRKWNYVDAILKNWTEKGRSNNNGHKKEPSFNEEF